MPNPGATVTDEPEATSDVVAPAAAQLAQEIRRLREAAALSQAKLASKIGYSPQYVSLAERPGKGLPSRELVAALDTALAATGSLISLRQRALAEQHQVRRRQVSASPAVVPSVAVEQPATEVAAILAMSNAFQTADRQVGGGVLYDQVARYLSREIGPRLLDPVTAGPQLFSAAASVTEIAGWMAHDSGRDDQARRHFDHAFRLASAAGNAALAGNVCASMSHLAGQLGQANDAVRIAEEGLSRARRADGTTRLTARLYAMKARGLAMAGDQSGCATALDEAAAMLATVGDEQPAEWIAGFDEASLASEAALCLRKLGRLTEAEQYARRVIQLRASDRVRSRAFAQLVLARVLLEDGRVDEAAAVGQEVCAVAPTLTSSRVRTRLDRFGEAMAAHVGVPATKAFLTQLALAQRGYQQPTTGGAMWPV
jgi:transcriptional regulator with XRE-family HTH domain